MHDNRPQSDNEFNDFYFNPSSYTNDNALSDVDSNDSDDSDDDDLFGEYVNNMMLSLEQKRKLNKYRIKRNKQLSSSSTNKEQHIWFEFKLSCLHRDKNGKSSEMQHFGHESYHFDIKSHSMFIIANISPSQSFLLQCDKGKPSYIPIVHLFNHWLSDLQILPLNVIVLFVNNIITHSSEIDELVLESVSIANIVTTSLNQIKQNWQQQNANDISRSRFNQNNNNQSSSENVNKILFRKFLFLFIIASKIDRHHICRSKEYERIFDCSLLYWIVQNVYYWQRSSIPYILAIFRDECDILTLNILWESIKINVALCNDFETFVHIAPFINFFDAIDCFLRSSDQKRSIKSPQIGQSNQKIQTTSRLILTMLEIDLNLPCPSNRRFPIEGILLGKMSNKSLHQTEFIKLLKCIQQITDFWDDRERIQYLTSMFQRHHSIISRILDWNWSLHDQYYTFCSKNEVLQTAIATQEQNMLTKLQNLTLNQFNEASFQQFMLKWHQSVFTQQLNDALNANTKIDSKIIKKFYKHKIRMSFSSNSRRSTTMSVHKKQPFRNATDSIYSLSNKANFGTHKPLFQQPEEFPNFHAGSISVSTSTKTYEWFSKQCLNETSDAIILMIENFVKQDKEEMALNLLTYLLGTNECIFDQLSILIANNHYFRLPLKFQTLLHKLLCHICWFPNFEQQQKEAPRTTDEVSLPPNIFRVTSPYSAALGQLMALPSSNQIIECDDDEYTYDLKKQLSKPANLGIVQSETSASYEEEKELEESSSHLKEHSLQIPLRHSQSRKVKPGSLMDNKRRRSTSKNVSHKQQKEGLSFGTGLEVDYVLTFDEKKEMMTWLKNYCCTSSDIEIYSFWDRIFLNLIDLPSILDMNEYDNCFFSDSSQILSPKIDKTIKGMNSNFSFDAGGDELRMDLYLQFIMNEYDKINEEGSSIYKLNQLHHRIELILEEFEEIISFGIKCNETVKSFIIFKNSQSSSLSLSDSENAESAPNPLFQHPRLSSNASNKMTLEMSNEIEAIEKEKFVFLSQQFRPWMTSIMRILYEQLKSGHLLIKTLCYLGNDRFISTLFPLLQVLSGVCFDDLSIKGRLLSLKTLQDQIRKINYTDDLKQKIKQNLIQWDYLTLLQADELMTNLLNDTKVPTNLKLSHRIGNIIGLSWTPPNGKYEYVKYEISQQLARSEEDEKEYLDPSTIILGTFNVNTPPIYVALNLNNLVIVPSIDESQKAVVATSCLLRIRGIANMAKKEIKSVWSDSISVNVFNAQSIEENISFYVDSLYANDAKMKQIDFNSIKAMIDDGIGYEKNEIDEISKGITAKMRELEEIIQSARAKLLKLKQEKQILDQRNDSLPRIHLKCDQSLTKLNEIYTIWTNKLEEKVQIWKVEDCLNWFNAVGLGRFCKYDSILKQNLTQQHVDNFCKFTADDLVALGLGQNENKNDIHRILHFIAKINKKQQANHRKIFSDDLFKRKNEEIKKKKGKILQRDRRDSEVTQKRSSSKEGASNLRRYNKTLPPSKKKASIAQPRANYNHPLPIFKKAKNNFYDHPLPPKGHFNKARSAPTKPKSKQNHYPMPPPPPPKAQKKSIPLDFICPISKRIMNF